MNRYKNKEPAFKDFDSFLDIRINNLEFIGNRTLQTAFIVMQCWGELEEYNRKYLNYKLANIPTESLNNLMTKLKKFYTGRPKNTF